MGPTREFVDWDMRGEELKSFEVLGVTVGDEISYMLASFEEPGKTLLIQGSLTDLTAQLATTVEKFLSKPAVNSSPAKHKVFTGVDLRPCGEDMMWSDGIDRALENLRGFGALWHGLNANEVIIDMDKIHSYAHAASRILSNEHQELLSLCAKELPLQPIQK